MTTRDTNDIRELTTSELETVSGSSIVEGVRTAVTLAGCARMRTGPSRFAIIAWV
jgi:hypothetical protein